MIKKAALHKLIKALTKTEKRYFKLFCSRVAGGDNYLRLFDAIDKQEVYSEGAIKEQFMNRRFVRQLHVTKNYLRKLILKSLRNFHSSISRDAEFKDIMRSVEILYNKELYHHCDEELLRAETIARRFELAGGMVELAGWKRKLEQAMRPHNYSAFRKVLLEQKKAIGILENTNSYWQLAVDVSESLFDMEKPSRIRKMPSRPGDALTLEAKILHYNTSYLVHLQRGREAKAQQELYTLIALLEKDPHRIKEEPGLYVSTINNLVSYLVYRRKYDEGIRLIEKARGFYNSWEVRAENRTLLKQILRTYNIELEIYRITKKGEEDPGFIAGIQRFVELNVHKMPKEYLLSFWFQFASIYFTRKDFRSALKWINRMLDSKIKTVRTDLSVQAQFLNLMVHLEQNNLMVLRYYVDSARRYLRKISQVHPYENVLLKFFTKIGRLPRPEHQSAFADLKQQLFPAGRDSIIPADRREYIDFAGWIASRLKGQPRQERF